MINSEGHKVDSYIFVVTIVILISLIVIIAHALCMIKKLQNNIVIL